VTHALYIANLEFRQGKKDEREGKEGVWGGDGWMDGREGWRRMEARAPACASRATCYVPYAFYLFSARSHMLGMWRGP